LAALGVAVIAAIAAGTLAWQHFQRPVYRQPLMAVHEAFAAKLRSQASDLREVRELSVPRSDDNETLLALASSEDSNVLAVATTRQLLCFLIANERWTQWQLPRPIESAGALHVDSESGKAHVIVGDDGTLLTGDCRAPGSALLVTASTTKNQPAVAWIDVDEQLAWIAPAHPAGAEVEITAQPLPGTEEERVTMRVAFPGEANSLFGKAAVVHSIAKVGDNILLFYGDADLVNDSDLRDESVLVIDSDEPKRRMNRLVFAAAAAEEQGGKTRWRSTHVRRLLPASAPGRVYALTDGPAGVAVLGAHGKPIDVHSDSLFATEYREGREIYDLGVKAPGDVAVMEVSRRGTGPRLNYQLPWRFKHEPSLAAISSEGRHVVIANAAGDILLIDLAKL
jgi:hypothetical protein